MQIGQAESLISNGFRLVKQREPTWCALHRMAALDDEICWNELEGNWLGDEIVTFSPRAGILRYAGKAEERLEVWIARGSEY